MTAPLTDELRDAILGVEEAHATYALAIATRDEVICRMVKGGESMYRVAKLAGLSQTMVKKIVTT